MNSDVMKWIENEIQNNDVVLFMKGNAAFPQCGFSSAVASILGKLGVEFRDVNVLENDAIRDAIKNFSDWPTIPQLYLRGEFIGGCDIVRELYQSGELEKILRDKSINYNQE